MKYFFYYLIGINIIAFVLFGIDKFKAKRQLWRIKEFTLIVTAILGGSLGAFLGMLFFRHKTTKPKFVISIPLIILIQFLAIYFIIFR